MMDTGSFTGYKMFRLLDQDEQEGLTYVIQYSLTDLQTFRTFETSYPELALGPVKDGFFPQCMAFQTIMSEV